MAAMHAATATATFHGTMGTLLARSVAGDARKDGFGSQCVVAAGRFTPCFAV
jgi:hypothetical protein